MTTAPESNQPDLVSTADEVLAALPETIVQVDPDERIFHVNRVESPVFSRRVSRGDRLEDVIVPEAIEALAGILDNVEFTGGALAEFRTDTDLFRVTAKPLASAPVTLLIFRNITGIRTAGQTIVDLVRDRSNFLAAVSHELRTPLTAVVGYANLLADTGDELDETMRGSMVRDMTDQAWDLAGIVEDLLTVASAELGELHIARVRVDIGANVAQVVESMGGRAANVAIEASSPVHGVGDPAHYRQVVRNLVSNALRHGEEPVQIQAMEEDNQAVLRVIDRGQGLPDQIAELLAVGADSGKSTTPGKLGLGLWISQELTRLMGGNLTYERSDGKTIFTAAIPSL
ncbi:MAG TPA: HAMP domain-containing sensor histidine kinase [Acidimicrobiia bacterium]|nr:HAMP domain-containing sensor histidine kinase [Acidimicrobiia bacterium]